MSLVAGVTFVLSLARRIISEDFAFETYLHIDDEHSCLTQINLARNWLHFQVNKRHLVLPRVQL